ncbi:hypothetical protein K4H02_27755, partial [Mycobacterium tuberculosis]|nr:hypothetical protein [Mycobacterium tuberculosis]
GGLLTRRDDAGAGVAGLRNKARILTAAGGAVRGFLVGEIPQWAYPPASTCHTSHPLATPMTTNRLHASHDVNRLLAK